jgi:hypothetical protein
MRPVTRWGKPLDSRGLADLLKDWGVKSVTVRIGNTTTVKSYRRTDLVDVWRRCAGRRLERHKHNEGE